MYNYYTDLIWLIDKTLLGVALSGGLLIILYAMVKEYHWKKRRAALLNIKRNVYELVLSGQKAGNQACLPPSISGLTPQQFLDVTTNRNREAVFFNEAEQKLLKGCFISPKKLAEIEKIALFSWNKWRRIEAILTLGYAQAISSVNTLKKTINHKDPDIVYFSIIALGQIKEEVTAKALLSFVKKRKFYRYRLFSLLEDFPPGIAEEVITLTRSLDPGVRSWAIRLICRLKALRYSEAIEELARDKSAEVRASACDCLGEFGKKSSAAAIARCLTDDSWMVRVSAVGAFFKVLGKEALPEIMRKINDGSLSVIESVKSLITGNIEVCLPYVERFLLGNDEIARRVAVEALEASGYVLKLLKDMASSQEKDKIMAERLMRGLIASRAYAGLAGSLLSLPADERGSLLNMIRKTDQEAAGILEEYIAGRKG